MSEMVEISGEKLRRQAIDRGGMTALDKMLGIGKGNIHNATTRNRINKELYDTLKAMKFDIDPDRLEKPEEGLPAEMWLLKQIIKEAIIEALNEDSGPIRPAK